MRVKMEERWLWLQWRKNYQFWQENLVTTPCLKAKDRLVSQFSHWWEMQQLVCPTVWEPALTSVSFWRNHNTLTKTSLKKNYRILCLVPWTDCTTWLTRAWSTILRKSCGYTCTAIETTSIRGGARTVTTISSVLLLRKSCGISNDSHMSSIN